MRFTKFLIAAALVLLTSTLTAQQHCEQSTTGALTFSTSLFGSQFGGQGSPNAFGNGTITIDPSTNRATFNLNTSGLGGTITGARLNQNSGSGSGQQFLSLTDDDNMFDENGSFERSFILTQSQMNQLLANPGNFSLGVNTGEFSNGAISGSLLSGQTFGGTLSGASVTGSGNSGTNAGAQNGGGAFTATIVPNTSGSGSVLNYSFSPTGIGNNITSLGLFQGGAGTSGNQFVSLGNGGTLNNGRLTGSVNLTQQQAQQLMTDPSAFYLQAGTSQFPNGAVRSQFGGSGMYEYYVPVAGSARGALGNQWQTDLMVWNGAGGAPATVIAHMLQAGQSNVANGSLNATQTAVFTVNGGSISNLQNSLQSLFNMSSGVGALHIMSDQPLVITARIYDANAADEHGMTAQQIHALTRCEALTRGVLIGAANANGNGAVSRTNIGFFNPNNATVTVNLWSGNANGTANTNGNTTITLQPYQQMQLPLSGSTGLFATNQLGSGAVTFEASAPIFAYTSVTNNGNGDTHVLMAKHNMSAPVMSEADIAAIVIAANRAEVEEGQLASTRATDADVRAFAQQMVADHSAALNQAQALFSSLVITPNSGNATAQFLTSMHQQAMAMLSGLSGATFDRQYMQTQVLMHQMVLTTMTQVLIPSARNAQLRSMLQAQAAHVQMHLIEAREILEELR